MRTLEYKEGREGTITIFTFVHSNESMIKLSILHGFEIENSCVAHVISSVEIEAKGKGESESENNMLLLIIPDRNPGFCFSIKMARSLILLEGIKVSVINCTFDVRDESKVMLLMKQVSVNR